MPSLDTPDSEEGPVHSCCVRRRNSEVLRTLLRHEAGPIDQDDQRKIVKALADEQVSYLPCLHPFAFHLQLLPCFVSGMKYYALG